MTSNTTSISTTTAVDAARFRHFGRDFETSWTAPVPHDARIVEDNGDLILQLQDLWDIDAICRLADASDLTRGCSFGEFLDKDVLQRWARGWAFSLGDINAVDALFKLVFAFLVPSIDELPAGRLAEDVQQVRHGKRRPDSLPPYTLRVDGSVVRYFLIDVYDGPFSSDGVFKGAALKRGKRKAPLIVTLHGYGESGTNNFSQVAGNQLSTAFADPDRQDDNRAYVLSPQANPGGATSGAWWDPAMQKSVIELVERTIAQNPGIDRDRVYISGMSMGSYGSWGVLAQRSDIFAGALLICGNGGEANVERLVAEVGDLPIWAVHSVDDAVVSYSAAGSDFRIFEALETAGTAVTWTAWDADVSEAEHESSAQEAVEQAEAANSEHIFTTYNAGTTLWGAHGSWVPVYNNDVMLDWLFDQTRD